MKKSINNFLNDELIYIRKNLYNNKAYSLIKGYDSFHTEDVENNISITLSTSKSAYNFNMNSDGKIIIW